MRLFVSVTGALLVLLLCWALACYDTRRAERRMDAEQLRRRRRLRRLMANLRNWQDKWQDGTYEKAAALETAMATTTNEARWPAGEREVLKNQLRLARERFKQHGYEADARECERLLLEIRALDPGFEEAR